MPTYWITSLSSNGINCRLRGRRRCQAIDLSDLSKLVRDGTSCTETFGVAAVVDVPCSSSEAAGVESMSCCIPS
ncbi:hypothetical protein MRX96_023204 [Rhipicephalus microplus]